MKAIIATVQHSNTVPRWNIALSTPAYSGNGSPQTGYVSAKQNYGNKHFWNESTLILVRNV